MNRREFLLPLISSCMEKPKAIGFDDDWQVRTLADAYRKRPASEYIIEGLFPAPSVSLVIGPSGGMKSMLLMDACACVAAGRPWLASGNGKHGLSTKKCPVLWYNADNPTSVMDMRFEAFGQAHELGQEVALHYYSFPQPLLDATDGAEMKAFQKRIQQLGVKFVVIDSLQDGAGKD